jgi:hypothetical protein
MNANSYKAFFFKSTYYKRLYIYKQNKHLVSKLKDMVSRRSSFP